MSRDARPWPAGWSMRTRLVVWLLGSGVGVAVIALPDSDGRVLSLSRTHGPAPVDLVGMLVLLAVWLPVPVLLWARRRALGGQAGRAALGLAVVGLVALVVTVGLDLGASYWLAVAALLVAQGLALRTVARHRPAEDGVAPTADERPTAES